MIMMMMMKIILLLALPTAAPIGCHPPAVVGAILHTTLRPLPRRCGRGGASEWGGWDEGGSTRGGGGAGDWLGGWQWRVVCRCGEFSQKIQALFLLLAKLLNLWFCPITLSN